MSGIFQVILSAVAGAIIGSACFGLWFTLLMSVYIFLYGSYSVNLLILSSVRLDSPIFTALIVGLIVGSILGFFIGLTIGLFSVSSILKCMVIGITVTAIFLFGLFFLSSTISTQNPVEFILTTILVIPFEVVKNFWLFIPSVATGAIMAKVISFIASK